jgi:hypothetical protein
MRRPALRRTWAALEVGDDANLATCGEHVTGQECNAASAS